MTYDYCIIGGGIVGLATAMHLLIIRPGCSVLLLEKEKALGLHQTGHNSNVIHSGAFAKPGTLKAKLCRTGAEEMKRFCIERDVPVETCGKLRVATNPVELQRMDALFERSKANNVAMDRLDKAELKRVEPNINGIGAILVPSTAIVDFRLVCQAMGQLISAGGGTIELRETVVGIKESPTEVEIVSEKMRWTAKKLIVCAGLQSDRMARLAGVKIDYRIVPLRGEYYQLPPYRNGIINHLVYPIPDPAVPFVGIHLTRTVDKGVTVGPNAVLGFSREGYRKFSFNAHDVLDYATYSGFWAFMKKHLAMGIDEFWKSLSKTHYLAECRKYCSLITSSDLLPYRAGIRAHVLKPDGTPIEDFLFIETERMLHVCNAPSPAATAALPIGRMIAEKVTLEKARTSSLAG